MKFRRLFLAVLFIFPAICPAASKEMLELQREVAQIQDNLRVLQSSFDTKVGTLSAQVQQALDAANRMNTSLAGLQGVIQEQLRLQTLTAELGAERSRLDSSLTSLVDLSGDDLRSVAACRLRLRRQAENLAALGAKAERELAAQLKKYNASKQRVRLLEELRERKLERWRYDQRRQLETLATESYLSTWNRDHQ